ncbi:MAG: GNAT family N-acetyltransferase [Solobacterium sp.]|nr:GNAT family N-acetyltransferase [Solobacterium sp.]
MISLLSWRTKTIQDLEDLYADVDQTNCLVALPVPLPKQETIAYYEAIQMEHTQDKVLKTFAIIEEDAIIGKIELSIEEGIGELDFVLRKEHCNQKKGSEALQKFLELIQKENWCNEIVAYVHEDNLPMQKVLLKQGFQKTQPFKADVMVVRDGVYQLKEVKGSEYQLSLSEESSLA